MRKQFAAKVTGNETVDTLTKAFSKLVDMTLDGQNSTEEYKEANALFNKQFMEFCMSGTPLVFTSLEDIKSPTVYKNPMFKANFNTILSQAIVPVVPTVIASGYDQLFEVFQVGFGDNAKFTVASNELYVVNDIAEGIMRGGQATIYNQEYSVQARRRQIAIFVDWYQVAAGVHDWGDFGRRIGASYAAAIQAIVTKSMTNVIADAAKHGISGYVANGFNDTNWLTLARNVKLANGGAPVYALGTNIALGKILPQNAAFRFGSKSDIVTSIALPAYKDVPLIELGNALLPNTINGTPQAILKDDFVYMIAMGSNKPCKVVIEGQEAGIEEDPLFKADHTYGMIVDMRVGADCVVGSKFGYLKLA